jgi:hypothetical protein
MSAIQCSESEIDDGTLALPESLGRAVKHKRVGARVELRVKEAERIIGRAV